MTKSSETTPFHPWRVTVHDDDALALLGTMMLITRDARTALAGEFLDAHQLLLWLQKTARSRGRRRRVPDVVLLDGEYRLPAMSLPDLIRAILQWAPETTVICLTQHGDADEVQAAMRAGARGILLKSDLGLAVATAIRRVGRGAFVYTESVAGAVEALLDDFEFWKLRETADRLPRWQLHPDLPERYAHVARQSFLYGMDTRATAMEPRRGSRDPFTYSTVETYRTQIYNILADGWYDERDLREVRHLVMRHSDDKNVFSGEDWAFHMLTLLRRPDGLYH